MIGDSIAVCLDAELAEVADLRGWTVMGDTGSEVRYRSCATPERSKRMTSINMIAEEEATGRVKEVYEEIKEKLGIDFVPNMYKAMAHNPGYLETTWNKVKAIMHESGKLDSLTKDIIALTVSVMSGCDYCISVYTAAVRNLGLDDGAILEIATVVDLFSGLNRLNISLQVEPDEKPWYG
jgi:AhpD family alkylhydroperoxidase